jgi:hypothetical protein
MNTIAKLISVVGLFSVLVSLSTISEAKAPKVCSDWLPYATTRTDVKTAPKVFVCFDNEAKPYMMIDPKMVTTKDKDGNTVNLLVEIR